MIFTDTGKKFNNEITTFLEKYKKDNTYITNLTILGEGYNSIVYKITDKIAIKKLQSPEDDVDIYEFEFNLLCDLKEYDLNCFPEVYAFDRDNKLLFVENVEGNLLKDIKQLKTKKIQELYKLVLKCNQLGIQLNDLHSENIILTNNLKFYFIDVGEFHLYKDTFYIPEFFKETLDIDFNLDEFLYLDTEHTITSDF